MTAKQSKTDAHQPSVQGSLAIDETTETLPRTFEDAYAELQEIVSTMESGHMSLETSLKAYQRGDTLLQFCQKQLSAVEQQVNILNEQNKLDPYQADVDQAI